MHKLRTQNITLETANPSILTVCTITGVFVIDAINEPAFTASTTCTVNMYTQI